VGTERINCILECYENSLGLAHFLTFNRHHPICPDCFWPEVLTEECHMMEDVESKMIGNQLLCRIPEIDRIPIQKLFAHFLPNFKILVFFLGYDSQKNIIKNFLAQVFWIYKATKVPLQKMRDCIEGHVDCRVGECFYQPL